MSFRIPPLKRLTAEDFKDQSVWIGKLLGPLNDFMNTVVTFLQDSIKHQVKELEFTQATDVYPIKFTSALPTAPVGLWVVKAQENDSSPATLTSAIWAHWEYKNGLVQINSFSGLTNGQKYKISVIIIA
jgi:hypothetical protein